MTTWTIVNPANKKSMFGIRNVNNAAGMLTSAMM
jgi:hypothetical protein